MKRVLQTIYQLGHTYDEQENDAIANKQKYV